MSEETPIFKFKKKEMKKIGDFDVLDSTEWTLLVKPQIQDVTLFVHFQKLWNVTEVPGVEADPDNGIEAVKEVKAHPAWQHNIGFIKEDKFIVTSQKTVSEQTYHAIQKRYVRTLESYMEQGYKKDYDNYKLDEPIVPHYYINERTSQESMIQQQMASVLRNQNTGIQAPQQVAPPAGNPHVMIKPSKTGIFSGLKKKTQTNP